MTQIKEAIFNKKVMLYKDLSIFFSLIKPASAYDNSFHYIAVMDEWMAEGKKYRQQTDN